MKQNGCNGLLLALMVMLSFGCTPGTMTTTATRVAASPTGRFAPPYAEIKKHIESITKTEEHPDGPPVGDDGIQDPKIIEAIGAYQDSLVDDRVEGWEVWILSFTETDLGNPNSGYNLALTTQEPKEPAKTHAELVLYNFPREQFKKLELWKQVELDPTRSFGSCIGRCQQAVLSGVISGIQSDGVVYLREAILVPKE